VEVIAEALHTPRLARALTAFQRGMTFDSALLSPGVHEDMITLADLSDRYPHVPLAERLTLASAPVDTRLDWLVEEYGYWMGARASDAAVGLEPLRSTFLKERARSDYELKSAEMEAKRLTLYSWLAFRFPETFPDLEECRAQRVALDRFIERSLASRGGRKRAECRLCGGPLGRGDRAGVCTRCRARGRRSA
jgi:ATP-dependent RNA helicase SUPV3L1/SUV3